jgi:predicted RNA-binding protein YlxR (DUF448 family)
VELDPTGRAAGRGAYLHAERSCAERAVRTGALARALRAPLDRSEAATLVGDERLTQREERT